MLLFIIHDLFVSLTLFDNTYLYFRCVLLFEPFKYDSKSIDSCVHFFRNLRLLLIQAYSRHLNKYEEKLQVFRESRGEEGWFFFEYFTMQVSVDTTVTTLRYVGLCRRAVFCFSKHCFDKDIFNVNVSAMIYQHFIVLYLMKTCCV